MLNHSQRESGDDRRGGGGEEDQRSFVAVAIEKDKASQAILKWAIDNIVTTDHIVKLVHVNHKSNFSPSPVGVAQATMELFLPFRCYCNRKQVDCEVVVLDDHDIGKALIEYVTDCGIETLVLGASKNAMSKPIKPINKIFKVVDLPSSVLKAAPDFCNVYIISKGKVQGTRSATRPVPFIPADTREAFSANKLTFEGATLCGDREEIEYDEFSENQSDSLPGRAGLLPERGGLVRASRVSADTAFFAFCDNLGSEMSQKYQNSDANGSESSWSEPKGVEPYSPHEDMSPVVRDSERTSFSLRKPEEMEDEIKRLKMELKHTMEMYFTACKEALDARRKVREIQEWKKKEEQRLQEADLADMAVKSAQEKYEATQKLLEQEVEEKQELLTKLGDSSGVVKYQNLYHIVVVLFVFYFYFTIRIILLSF